MQLSDSQKGFLAGAAAGVGLASIIGYFISRPSKKANIYESQQMVDEYLLMHYGTEELLMPRADGPKHALLFAQKSAQKCIEWAKRTVPSGQGRALDVGCAVGGAVFELAKHFKEVVGVDYCHAFVNTANDLKKTGSMEYAVKTEGLIRVKANAVIDADVDRSRVAFQHGDGCSLDVKSLGQFDVVMGANLLCRLPKPSAFLEAARSLVASGGYLVLLSPFTWMSEFTPVENWLGGYYDKDQKAVSGKEGIAGLLREHFDLVEESEMPFFIRETARKNQFTYSYVCVWRRK